MRAVVVHGTYDDFGGAEVYSLRVIELLQSRFDDVIVLHYGQPLDLDMAEQSSGVILDRSRIRFQVVRGGRAARFLRHRRGGRLKQLEAALNYRALQRFVENADLLATTANECTLRAKCVLQSTHFPQYVCDRDSLGYLGWSSNNLLRYWLQVFYVFFIRFLVGWNREYIGSLPTVANSTWTADQFKRHYPVKMIKPIHLGVKVGLESGTPEWVPFDKRNNAFVILGRVTPSKKVDRAIAILSCLRGRGHDVSLTIIGRASPEYDAELEALISGKAWVRWYRGLDRVELEREVARHKWGLHCYEFEHYGLAPAELQALGCITFVHDSGGQREVITNPLQRYRSLEDAVQKIENILIHPSLQNQLLAEGRISAKRHTLDHFRESFLAFLDEVMALSAAGLQY
jgi:glycosyltransferase involved in cell wall biosynthesis